MSQSMREILDQMNLNHELEQKQKKEASKFKQAINKKPNTSYRKIPNIQAVANAKSITYSRNTDTNKVPVQIEVETELCKWCESEIMKGREFCSDRCRGLFVDN